MVEGSCHCGAVRIFVDHPPETVTDCNCSICRRLGGLTAYYKPFEVRMEGEEATFAYSWGDKDLAFHTCRTCGCNTHTLPVSERAQGRIAVNARMFDPAVIVWARIRRFDGADTWKTLGER